MTDYKSGSEFNYNRERFESLVMAAVDGELDQRGKIEFDALIQEHPELAGEFMQFKRIKEVTRAMRMKSPADEVWDTYWYGVYNRIERNIGWILLSVGAIILMTYGLYRFVISLFADQQIEVFVKIAIISVLAGAVILLISVLREKLSIRRKDPYKEVKR